MNTSLAIGRVSKLAHASVSPLIAVLVFLHVVKAGFFALAGPAPLYRDAKYYWELATRIAAGDWLLTQPPDAMRTAGYPWFLAVHARLFGDAGVSAAAITQQFLASFVGLLAAWICWRVTASRVAVVAALLLSLAAVSRFVIAHYLWSDTLLSVMITVTLAAFVEWWRATNQGAETRRARGLALVLGLCLGACAMTRPVAQLLAIPMLAAMLVACSGALPGRALLRRVAPHALALAIGFGLVTAPWLARNQMAYGEIFFVKFTGRTTWLSCFDPRGANLPFIDAPAMNRVMSIVGPDADRRDLWDIYARLTRAGHSEIEADELMAAATRETIAHMPGRFAVETAKQYLEFWDYPWPVPRWRQDDPLIELEGTFLDQRPLRADWIVPHYQRLLDRVGGPRRSVFRVAAAAAAAALTFLLWHRRTRPVATAIAAILLYFSVVTTVASYPMYRFRSILEPTMIVAVAMALGCAWEFAWRLGSSDDGRGRA